MIDVDKIWVLDMGDKGPGAMLCEDHSISEICALEEKASPQIVRFLHFKRIMKKQ